MLISVRGGGSLSNKMLAMINVPAKLCIRSKNLTGMKRARLHTIHVYSRRNGETPGAVPGDIV